MQRHIAIGLLSALWLASCGSDSPTSSSDSATDSRRVQANPSFATTIQEIFDRRSCTSASCHGTAQMAGLDLRSGASYGELVSVLATSEAILRVVPATRTEATW